MVHPVTSIHLAKNPSRLPVYLISYADGNEVFYGTQHALVYSAQNKGFDIFCNYCKAFLIRDFKEEYKDIMDIPRDAGLWLWKPQILLETMQRAPENALIVYADVGYVYVKPIDGLFHMIQDNGVMLMNLNDYVTNEKLIDWLPKEIAAEWQLETLAEQERPKFIDAGLIVVRNTARARQFIEKWLDICARRDYAFLTYDCQQEQIKGVTYDQSLLSLIAYKYPDGVKIVPKAEFKKFTVFHHRHPGKNKPLLHLQVLPAKEIRE